MRFLMYVSCQEYTISSALSVAPPSKSSWVSLFAFPWLDESKTADKQRVVAVADDDRRAKQEKEYIMAKFCCF